LARFPRLQFGRRNKAPTGQAVWRAIAIPILFRTAVMGFAKRPIPSTRSVLPANALRSQGGTREAFKPSYDRPDGLCDYPTGKSPKSPSIPSRKNILIFRIRKSGYIHPRPAPPEGRFANVTDVGAGCGGRFGARDGRCRADGQVVWVRRPNAGVKFAGHFPRATVSQKHGHRDDHEATV
jgi:hypothetical protein